MVLRAILVSIIALLPLVMAPGLLFYFDVTPKVVILLLGAGAALPWFTPAKLKGRWIGPLLVLQGLSLFISTIFSNNGRLSIFGTNWRRFGLITQATLLLFTALAAAEIAGNRTRLSLYLRAITATAIPISLYGIAQYFGWDPWISKQAYHIGQGFWTIVRPPATLGYVSYFAIYMVFAVFLAAASYRIEQPGWWRRLAGIAVMASTCALVLSGTRAGILALLIGATYLWCWSGWRIRTKVVAGAGAVAAMAILFYFSPAGQMLRSRTRWYIEDPAGGARVLLWRDSFALATRHWLVGAGPETFSVEFPQVQSASLSRAYPGFYFESAHNIFLDALTAQGGIGFVALVAFACLGFHAASRARKAEPVLAGTLGAALAAGLFAQQFSVFTTPTALYFYLTVAMLTAIQPGPATGSRVPWTMAVPVSAALMAYGLLMLAADHELEGVRTTLERGQTLGVAERYQRVRKWGLTADIWYSRQMATIARAASDPVSALTAWQQAIEAGFRATTTADDPHNAWYSLAVLHSRENDFRQTEKCLQRAIATSPNWFKPHWMLAQVLDAEGRRKQALSEAVRAADLNGGKNPEVAAVLAKIRDDR